MPIPALDGREPLIVLRRIDIDWFIAFRPSRRSTSRGSIGFKVCPTVEREGRILGTAVRENCIAPYQPLTEDRFWSMAAVHFEDWITRKRSLRP
jgi:hypothetical protein